MNTAALSGQDRPFILAVRRLVRMRRVALGDGSAMLGLRVFSILAGLSTSILLARNLGAAGYGLYAQFFSLAGLMALAVQHGMPTLLTREIALAYQKNRPLDAKIMLRWSLLRSLIFSGLIIATLAAIMGLLAARDLISLSPPLLSALVLVMLMVPAIAIMRNCSGALAGLHKVALGHTPHFLIVPCMFLLGLGVTLLTHQTGSLTALAARSIAELCGMILALALVWRHIGAASESPCPHRLRAWDKALIPLSLVTVAMTVNHHVDIQMLGLIAGAGELGLYRVAEQIAIVPMVVMQVVSALTAPRVAAAHARTKLVQLRTMLALGARAMTIASILFVLVFALLGKPVMEVVFGVEFARSHAPAVILSLGVMIAALFGASIIVLNMTGLETLTARHALMACVTNMGLNALLIPLLGAKGAAYATSVSLVMLYGMSWNGVRKRHGVRCDAFPGGHRSQQ